MTIDHPPLTITPAAPGRRWLAAAIDTFLLFVGHVVLWFIWILVLPDVETYTLLEMTAALMGLAYLLLFWALRSATPGQMALDIVIVRYDGAPLTWGDAFRRLGGYLLAALPLHVGFLPIFWDRYRRGWHDRLARTIVIRRQPSQHRLPLPPPTETPLPLVEEPALPLTWHRWALAGGIYIGLSLCATYPLIKHFSTHCAGDGADAFHFLWSLWHAHEALINGRESLLTTESLYHPLRTHLLYYSACWAYAVPAAFVQQWLTLTQTYNLFFLLSLSLSALAAFALARALHGDFPDALLAGILFSLSPYVMAHGAEGHLELMTVQFIALFALLCYRALTRSSLLWSSGAGVSLALVGYGAWYYLVAALLMSLCLTVGVAFQRNMENLRTTENTENAYTANIPFVPIAQRIALIWLSGALCLSPLLLPMLRERSGTHYMDMPLSMTRAYSIDPAHIALSNNLHPFWGKWVAQHLHPGSEQVAGLSFMALVLAVLAAYQRRRKMLPWTLTGITFLILACGPSLRVADREPILPSWLAMLGGGPPGNGFDLPFRADLSMRLALYPMSQPEMLWSSRTSLSMPFVWLRNIFPPLRPFRAPGRFIIVTSLCVAVLAACGLRLVRHAVRRRWGRRGELVAVSAVISVVLLEYLAAPFPITSTRVSPFYHELAKEPAPCVIADVPIEDARKYNFYQTVHRKPLFFGFHSRVPPQALRLRDRNRLLAELVPTGGYVLRRSLKVEGIVETKPLTELRATFAPSLRELASVGGKYIIVHKEMLTDHAVKQADRLLREALALPLRWDDRAIRVYQIPEAVSQGT